MEFIQWLSELLCTENTMSPLIRLLLIPAALSLWSSVAVAKDIPGLPKELLGTFSDSAGQCDSYFAIMAKGGAPEEIRAYHFFQDGGKSYYGYCGRTCQAPILSYSTVRNGYVLNLEWHSLQGRRKETLSVTKLDKNKLRLRFLPNAKPFDVVRCSNRPFEPDNDSFKRNVP